MTFKNRLKMRVKLLRFGKTYTITRTTLSDPVNTTEHPNPDAKTDAIYKTKVPVTTTFTERCFVRPARAYAIHSDESQTIREGGLEMSGIINVEVPYTSNIHIGDVITTSHGMYNIVAQEEYDEIFIFEAHRK